MAEHDIRAAPIVVVTLRTDQNVVHAVVVLVAGYAQRAARITAGAFADDLHANRARNETYEAYIAAPHVRGRCSKHYENDSRALFRCSHHEIGNSVVVEVARA
jgi:hypothetical protein